MSIKPILVVSGEPNSVFLELFFKTRKLTTFKKPIILIGSKELLIKQMKYFNFDFKINLLDKKNIKPKRIDNKKINLIDVQYDFKKAFDKITNNSNSYIEESFNVALSLLKTKNYAGLVNGPISKKNFLHGKFLGITEYLAHKTKIKNDVVMLIYNPKLSVSPLTTHLPLKDVHKKISKGKISNHVELIEKFYLKYFKKKPRIALTGLNPHSESNYKNSEEDLVIRPSIKKLLKKKFDICGPLPADTVFMKENSKKYDVIIGMYHDQVLSPMKALFGFDAINITLGLPFTRISPDHGPNYPMLGKNLSSPKSLIQALKFLDK